MVRLAAPGDFAAIRTFDVFAGDRRREIGERRCLVFEANGRAAGYLSWAWYAFVVRDYITAVCVSESYRRRGLATALLKAAEQTIGAGRLFISTEADNSPMLALLAREGWTPAGCVAGANKDGVAEGFFYKDLPVASEALGTLDGAPSKL